MSRMQALVLLLFTMVTFANVYLVQPGVDLTAEMHAAVVAATISLFFLAFNLKRFADLSGKPDPMIEPALPAGMPGALVQEVAAATLPTPAAPPKVTEPAA